MADQQSPNNNIGIARVGLNTDFVSDQLPQGSLTYALNAVVESFDGEAVTYQNESWNTECITLPEGFRAIHSSNIVSINRTLFFITNPSTGDSEIGYADNGECEYHTLIADKGNSDKFNFSIDHPIHEIIIKTTNCSTQAYWTDEFNPPRYIDFDNLPWKEVLNPLNPFKPTKLVGQLDSNKLLLQPVFKIPQIKIDSVTSDGSLVAGTYQFAVRYANALGDSYTSFYNITNPVTIHDNKVTPNFNLETSKAINLFVENIDTTSLYEYISVAVVKTINDIPTVELVGTYKISSDTLRITYTGADKTAKRLDITEVIERFPYYNIAKGMYEVDNVLGMYGLSKKEAVNYQQIFSKVKLLWETWKIPYNKFEGYNNGANSAKYRGYMRDEVYTFEGCLVFDNGEESDYCHIPGRSATTDELTFVNNNDANSILEDKCAEPTKKRKWQVYNTATKTGYSKEYIDYKGDPDCYIGPYEYGEFAYWESIEPNPGNTDIWGDLAGKPQKHHKFPDSLITHIHDNNTTNNKNFQHSIFPIGVRVDIDSLYKAIQASDLTEAQKRSIVGFKIARGDRANNKSIKAKGIFNNVGKYTYVPTEEESADPEGESQTYYLPNYPYNDLRPDPYFTDKPIRDHSGYRPDRRLNAFADDDSRSRFTFHSPDTHFYQPFGIDSGQIKLETIEYGESYGHFIKVDENAEYLFINKNGYNVAYGGGIASMVNGVVTYTTPWDYQVGANLAPENFGPSFQATLEILRKVLPYNNFGYSFNSYGNYNKYYAIPNDGNKIRNIEFGKYLNSEYTNIEAGNIINNYQRESSVYLYANHSVLYPHEYDKSIPEDTSRYNISSYIDNDLWDQFFPIFKANSFNVITGDDILFGITSANYEGPTITTILMKAVQIAQAPSIGDVYEYYNKDGTSLGTLQVTNATSLGSGFNHDFSVEFIPVTASIDSIYNSLTQDASDHSHSASVKFIYVNNDHVSINNGNTLKKITGNLGVGFVDNFDNITGVSYQTYVSSNSIRLLTTVNNIRTLYSTVVNEEDLEAFNVVSPSTVSDFEKLAAYQTYIESFVRYQNENSKQGSPDKIREAKISSYYGSIKQILPSQWGRMYSYKTIDTGYYHNLYDENGKPFTRVETVFGGDIFINRFGLKSKLPLFEDNTVKGDDDADIEFDKIATLTYPMFWFSTRPVSSKSDIANYIKKKAQQVVNNAGTVDAFQLMLAGVYAIEITFKILVTLLNNLGVRNLNLENFKNDDLYEKGFMYLFVYGIPYFFVESEVNVDHRQASNEKEGNFYPNVAGDIPDEWLQEANVSIINDNVYYYNRTFSKQNVEGFYNHLREDYDPTKLCFTKFPNRTIYTDKSSLEETKNNWLVFKPSAYFDLPKSNGSLTAIDKLENKQLLVRFSNKSQIYNAFTTIDVKAGPSAYLGNDKLFTGAPPIDLSETDTGSGGSQHRFLLKTPYGALYCDSIRAEVVLLQGTKTEDLGGDKISKWLYQNLPFYISEDFPEVNIDNAYKNIGLHGTYDGYSNRVLITKLDYKLLDDRVKYDSLINEFYILQGSKKIKVELTDSNYFCDKSWTLSYSFNTKSWVSFHSYTPNYYVEYPGYFQSNSTLNGIQKVWDHGVDITGFNNYYGTKYPYILEYPFAFKFQDEILQNVKDYTTVRKYLDFDRYYEPEETIYFNKGIIYNGQESSGYHNFIPAPKKNLAIKYQYPKYNIDSKDILVSKTDNCYNYNTFWNIVKDKDQPLFSESCNLRLTNKHVNQDVLDYTQRAFKKATLRGKELRIRHILDNRDDVKLISKFIINQTVNSFI